MLRYQNQLTMAANTTVNKEPKSQQKYQKPLRGQQKIRTDEIAKAKVDYSIEMQNPPQVHPSPDKKINTGLKRRVLKSEKKVNDEFINFKWSMANMTHREVPVLEENKKYMQQLQERKQAKSLERREQMKHKAGFQSFEELMAEFRNNLKEEKPIMDFEVLAHTKLKESRMKMKEVGVAYP